MAKKTKKELPPDVVMSDEDILSQCTKIYQTLKSHWGSVYAGAIKDFRLLANGKLPAEMAADLSTKKYKYRAKAIPRIIINSINNVHAMIMHSTFNREDPFEFSPFGQEDATRAGNSTAVVKYGWYATKVRGVASKMLRDSLEIGAGFGEVCHYVDSPSVLRPSQTDPFRKIASVRYDGPKLFYRRPENIFLEPVRNFEDITVYARVSYVTNSYIQSEAKRVNGIFSKYAKNAKRIKKVDIQEVGSASDTSTDIQTTINQFEVPDFKVELVEMWIRMSRYKDVPATWHCVSIANPESSPVLLRIDEDPMGTGTHPLIMCVVYPKNNRMFGESIPEMLFDSFFTTFVRRNELTDYIKQMVNLDGMLIAPTGSVVNNPILANLGKIVTLEGASARDVQTIKMDATPIQAILQQDIMIKNEVDETLSSNRVSRGQPPGRREPATTIAVVDENSKMLQSSPIAEFEDTVIKPVARLYLADFQMFSAPEFVIRVLGNRPGAYEFNRMQRSEIIGDFDVICRASSEVLPKAVKQAAFAQIAQVYGPNPRVNLNMNKICVEHMKMLEVPNPEDFVKEDEEIYAEIQREESFMMATGMPWKALMHEPHDIHLNVHMGSIQEMMQAIMSQGVPYEKIQTDPRFQALQGHVAQHMQLKAQLNGQVNIPGQPTVESSGEALDIAGAAASVKSGGM